MHRLLRALLEAELERWRHDQPEHDGRHEPDLAAIKVMSRKLHHFSKSCIRHTQPTPLRASNAPNNSMHTRMFVSRKTKASSAPLHLLAALYHSPLGRFSGRARTRGRCGLRQSSGDRGGAASPRTSCLATPLGSALVLVLSTSKASVIVLLLVRKERRRSLPETKWRTLIYRLARLRSAHPSLRHFP